MVARWQGEPITIGLFDSGVGGLSVLRQLQTLSQLTGAPIDFLYIGDTARCPYGNREPKQIRQFICQIVSWLTEKGASQIVMACNTSAALGHDFVADLSPVPVRDLITPSARYIADNYKKVAVLATQSTVRSAAFSRKIHELASDCEVVEIACPKLVPLVESGKLTGKDTRAVLAEYTQQIDADVEALVFGCTHFPFLRQAMSELLPAGLDFIDPAELLLEQLAAEWPKSLKVKERTAKYAPATTSRLFTTGDPLQFKQSAATCLGLKAVEGLGTVDHLPLNNLEGRKLQKPAAVAELNAVSNVVPLTTAKSHETKIVAP